VATISLLPSAIRELVRVNGKECVTLTIARDALSSLIETARDVRSCLARLSPSLPPAVELVCEMDRSRRMADELNTLYRDALLSIFLLWGILTLFLGNNRAPLLLISSMLLSLAGTLLTFWALHIPLHLLTLAGLALGMGRLLDDSIVVLENLRRWTEPARGTGSIVEGTQEVLLPVAASTAATAGALVPVLYLPRGLQVYLLEFSVAVTVSLCISLLVSFAVIPVAAARWEMKGTGVLAHPRGRLASMYRLLLSNALRHRIWVLATAVWMFGLPVWLLPARIDSPSLPATLYNETVGGQWYAAARPVVNTLFGGASYQFFRNVPHGEFLDLEMETYLVMQVNFPQGTDITSIDATAHLLEQDLMTAGAPRLTTRLFDGALFLRIDFPDSMVATPVPGALRSRCLRLAAQTGGAAISVTGFGAGFSGGRDLQPAFTVRVLGYDYARVKQIAESLRENLVQNPRVTSADIDRSFGNWSRVQEIALFMDREAIARYGLTGQEVAAAMRSRASVLPQRTLINVQGSQLPCVVTVKGSDRLSVPDLASIAVPGKRSAPVPLRSLLSAQQRPAPSEIVREDQQYVRWVSFEYKGPYRHAEAFLDATLQALPLPEGYRFDRSGSSTISEKDQHALLMAALAALLVVFMVTASLYESLLCPLIIMLSVPFAYIGVFMAFVLARMPFGRGGYVSVIFLTGVAVANAIVVVDFIARKEKEGRRGIEAIVDASVCRLRPVLMTTLTTAGSLLPMLLGERSGVWYMLALGTLGGLITSTLLTLIVVPVVYSLAHTKGERGGGKNRMV
ncbi:efflux RND transporter permease subunit, partial [bacterium]